MQAVILAAGIGKRLRPITDTIPKCLVPVNGKPMIVNALELLESCGIGEVIIVVGYLKEKVYETLGRSFGKIKISYIENDIYDETNNVYSLWLARDRLNKDTILLECDLYYGGDLMDKILEGKEDCRVLVSKYESFMSGTVVEVGQDGVIKRLITAKEQYPGFDFSDKYKTVNIYYFSAGFLQQYFVPNLDLYVRTQGTSSYYELVLGALIYFQKPEIRATIVDGIKWFEIDDEADLHRAEYYFASQEERLKMVSRLHGGYWRYSFIDFCYLLNPYFPNEALLNEFKSALPSLVRNYPSGMNTIVNLMSRTVNIPAQKLVVGNGASELIRLLNLQYVKKVSMTIPTFNEYESELNPSEINYFDTVPHNFVLDAEAYVQSVKDSDSNIALIINPNNPTSIFEPKEKIEWILRSLKDLEMVIVDESFMDFVVREGEERSLFSVDDLLDEYPNLVLIRSLSKEFGIPGLRLGYLASANEKFVRQMRKLCPIWNINSLAEAFLEILPRYQSDYIDSLELVRRDRDNLYERILQVPYLKVYKPAANFVFAQVQGGITSAQLRERLFLDYDLLIKDCSNKTGLEGKNYVRVSVRKPLDNERLVTALRKIIKEG
jgi:histidinol-phosphate/aromatic aminotransferase/cobyric acid decarboxylase-like protein/choline kinase